uniref:Uncharacterized protein n=1 Tax=Phlebotomus papatasi TaxID=29031 RepID=A0A1B0DHC1_PHLPP
MTMGSESLTIAQLPSKIQSMKIESTAAGHQVSSQATSQVRKVPVRSGTVSSTTEESDTDSTDSFDDDLVDGDEGNNYHHSGGIKRISKGELENISRAGATTEFNFGSGCTSTPIRDKSHLPSLTNGVNLSIQLNSPEDTADDIGRQQQQQQQQEVNYYGECVVGDVNGGVKMVEKSPENGVVNEESVDKVTVETKEIVDMTQCSGEKQLTNQEIEKNMINREKSETNVTQVVAAPKWTTTKKKPWKEEPQNTTMVFNFSNRKDVPDYIENDGVVLRHSHSQQCHGTTAANSTQIHRQVGTTGMRIGGGGGTAGQQQQHRGSGSTVGECRATVQSSCERDGVRVSQAVASNGSSCVATKCCHEDILCEVHQSGRNNNNINNINSSSNLSSGGDFNSDSRDIVHFCDNRQLDDKMVAVQEMCGEKLEYDTSEELKYGAGIVSKLVSRFMSYTMRVSAAKERPSLDNLRRATSLNNLLDDDNEVVEVPQRKIENETVAREMMGDGKVVIDDVTVESVNSGGVNCDKGIYRHSRPQMGTYQHSEIMRRRQMGRGNDSLKRARSVDALLRVENRSGSGGGGGMMVDQDVAQDAIVEENSSPANGIMPQINADNSHVANICDVVTIEDKIVNARERGEAKPKRLKSFMEDPERPPPDLVKTTLRIFEATANRRGRPPTCRSGEVAAKVASFKSIISQEKPAILYPKPPVSPKKALVGKNVRCSSHRDAASTAAVATT